MGIFDTAYFFAWFIIFIFGTGLQKFVQAFVAAALGDPTPGKVNRLTLNPAVHHEPLGLIFAFLLSLHSPGVAWGKPHEFNTFRMRGGHWGRSLTGLVGPLSFFVLAFLIWLGGRNYILGAGSGDLLARLLTNMVLVSLILCAFNLIPIPPLDGYDIIKGLLPRQWEPQLLWVEKYGVLILIVLVLIVPFFLRINILQEFYIRPIVDALARLIGLV